MLAANYKLQQKKTLNARGQNMTVVEKCDCFGLVRRRDVLQLC